jgi:hypothetical protein
MNTLVAGLRARSTDASPVRPLVGRTFVNPLVDYVFIGGGITIPIFAALYFYPTLRPLSDEIPYGVFLAINGAHFAASTVRLYTKPGARREFPLVSWVLPIVCFAIVGVGLYWPRVGGHIKALYFTWSPFHYAAQTYGLATMYAMRSGARLDARDKRQIWWVCMLPFVYAFFTANVGGLFWFVSRTKLLSMPLTAGLYASIVWLLTGSLFLLPVSLFWQLHRRRGKSVPLISLLLQVTNGWWWIGSDYLNAWFWTSVFHSIQYLIIVTVRHVDDRVTHVPSSVRFRHQLLHGTAFYGFSLFVGYLLFLVAPAAYAVFGFNGLQAYAMMTMVINIHHFIVDGFIWRTRHQASQANVRVESVPIPA